MFINLVALILSFFYLKGTVALSIAALLAFILTYLSFKSNLHPILLLLFVIISTTIKVFS